ncbi:MAG: hypothetical protein IKU37_08125 [Candidatus Gastranaerophilales bacterium]|nr:hypothetical protein [Candidatus Gastranaerophilales bacterium]
MYSYDSVAGDEIVRLQEIFKILTDQMTSDMLEQIEAMMDKMAKEAKRDLPRLAKREQIEFNNLLTKENKEIQLAQEELAHKQSSIDNWEQKKQMLKLLCKMIFFKTVSGILIT